ncbi:hypothetical protein R1flu_015223 [Riccia fluitans]|uniref:Uncharacterized protein n=1 Tax=Riccia fluitans TaxID=41844 RepID=A0ABD1YLG0_9MARC
MFALRNAQTAGDSRFQNFQLLEGPVTALLEPRSIEVTPVVQRRERKGETGSENCSYICGYPSTYWAALSLESRHGEKAVKGSRAKGSFQKET